MQLQYIGARYIPKWYVNTNDGTADWQVNVEYEPLVWVTTSNNHLYLSKKTVPDNIGNPADNTEYWLDMGVFTTGQTEHLQEEIDDIIANMGDLDDLNTTDKTSIVASINEVLAATVETRKFLFLGDSYGTNYTYQGTPITGWLDKMATTLGIQSSQVSTQSFAGDGYGFIGYSGKTWLSKVNDMATDNDVTDVVIMGGANDIGYPTTQYSTLVTNIRDTIDALKTKFPNARLWLGWIGVVFSNITTNKLLTCMSVYAQEATHKGVIWMEGMQYILYNLALCTDNNHPNNGGTTYIANAASSILKGGGYDSIEPYSLCSRGTGSPVQATAASTIHYKHYNNDLYIAGNLGNNTFSASTSSPIGGMNGGGNNYFVIGKYEDIPINKTKAILGSVPGHAIWSSGGVRKCALLFTLENNYLNAYILDSDGSNYYNVNGSDTFVGIECQAFEFKVPLVREYL